MARRKIRRHRHRSEPTLADQYTCMEEPADVALAVLEVMSPVVADLPDDHAAKLYFVQLNEQVEEAKTDLADIVADREEERREDEFRAARDAATDTLLAVFRGERPDLTVEQITAAGALAKLR